MRFLLVVAACCLISLRVEITPSTYIPTQVFELRDGKAVSGKMQSIFPSQGLFLVAKFRPLPLHLFPKVLTIHILPPYSSASQSNDSLESIRQVLHSLSARHKLDTLYTNSISHNQIIAILVDEGVCAASALPFPDSLSRKEREATYSM